MKKLLVIAVVLLALAISAASAATVNLKLDNLAANGWKTTSSGSGFGVTENTRVGADGFQFDADHVHSVGGWAGMSSSAFSGMSLSSITSLKIRVLGTEGDSANWQPPTFFFQLYKAPTNLSNRDVMWIPFANGNPRNSEVWNTYDLATGGDWYIANTGAHFSTFAALKASMPDAFLCTDAQLAAIPSAKSGNAFNLGYCPTFNEQTQYCDSSRGSVDWFTVGVNGVETTYDLNAVPEPGSILALCTGLIGFIGLRRRH